MLKVEPSSHVAGARVDAVLHYGNRDDVDESSRTVASVLNEDQRKKVDWVRHRGTTHSSCIARR